MKAICGKCSGERKEKHISGNAEVIVGREFRSRAGKKVLTGGLKIFWGSSEAECSPASPGEVQLGWGTELSFRSLALVSRASLALIPHSCDAEASKGRKALEKPQAASEQPAGCSVRPISRVPGAAAEGPWAVALLRGQGLGISGEMGLMPGIIPIHRCFL